MKQVRDDYLDNLKEERERILITFNFIIIHNGLRHTEIDYDHQR